MSDTPHHMMEASGKRWVKLAWLVLFAAVALGVWLVYLESSLQNWALLSAGVALLVRWFALVRQSRNRESGLIRMATRLVQQGQSDKAVAMLREDYEYKARNHGASHPSTLLAAQQLCTLWLGIGKTNEARLMMARLEPILLAEHSEQPESWATVMQSAAELWLEAGLPEKADGFAKTGLVYARRMRKPPRRLEWGFLACQARAQVQLGNAEVGLQASTYLLQAASEAFGVKDPLTQQLATCVVQAKSILAASAASQEPQRRDE